MCLGIPEDIGQRHHLSHFQHLFASAGYAAGYYVYMWAEVLEADGFEAFAEAGDPFDPATAQRLLRTIYSSGNTQNPAEAYRRFAGVTHAWSPCCASGAFLQKPLFEIYHLLLKNTTHVHLEESPSRSSC
jgi:peptidyl-dipeptidase Dcp